MGPPSLLQSVPLWMAETLNARTDGVYVICACNAVRCDPIDVGESEQVGNRLRWHNRKREWEARIRGLPSMLKAYVHATPPTIWEKDRKRYRLELERAWRAEFERQGYTLCGVVPWPELSGVPGQDGTPLVSAS